MPKTHKTIYLDYAAAAPLWPAVIKRIAEILQLSGNPGSLHEQGYTLKQRWHDSLGSIAQQLGCTPDELIITSGATESANLAILGAINQLLQHETVHCISSTAEHAASYSPIKELERRGADVTWLAVNSHGQIDSQQLMQALTPTTRLVSVIAAHNETGALQPIHEIVTTIKAAERQFGHRILLHLDAAQWAVWQKLNLHAIGADLVTISGAKLGGPHCGLLYVRRDTPIEPIMYGGGQQQARRPGTEDVASIVGLAAAFDETWKFLAAGHAPTIKTLRDQLGTALEQAFPQLIRRDLPNGLPGILHLTLPGLDGEQAVYALSETGIAVATGSACSERLGTEDHRVRAALGIKPQNQTATLRISLGWQTTDEEITRAIPIFIDILEQTLAQAKLTKQLQASGRDLSQAYAKGHDE